MILCPFEASIEPGSLQRRWALRKAAYDSDLIYNVVTLNTYSGYLE